MKPGYLALYSHKYKAEKSVNYFCINLKPRRVFRVFVPFTNKELCSGRTAGPGSASGWIIPAMIPTLDKSVLRSAKLIESTSPNAVDTIAVE